MCRNKKVLLVYPFFPLYRLGVIFQLSKSIKFDLILASDFTTLDGIKGFGLTHFQRFNWCKLKNYWMLNNKLLWQSGLLNFVRFNELATVIFLANPYHISTWWYSIIYRLLGKRVIFWTHGIIKNERGIKLFLRKLFLRLPNEIMIYSHFSKNKLVELGFSYNRIHVIYNSVYNEFLEEFDNFDSASIDRNMNFSEYRNLVFIGRLTEHKKINLLLEAFNFLDPNCYRLHIVGDGPQMEIIRNFVAENQLQDHIVFYGSIYNENSIKDILSICDLCVSPGEVGLTAIHCMQYGVPVISHGDKEFQMPEFEIIVPKITGDFFVRDDVKSLKTVITDWFNQPGYDRNLIRQNCINQVKNKYNPRNQSEIIENVVLYEESY